MTGHRIGVVGIDLISASIAYALQEAKQSLEIIGYDADPAVADLAKVRGAFDAVRREPGPACEGAELVIVAQPLADMERTFAAISSHLDSGAVVTDTARLKSPVLCWADDSLPDHAFFVGGHLVLNPAIVGLEHLQGLGDARADLVEEALYCFTPSPRTPNAAIETCSWLAYTIGANPFFIDAQEHDGLLAGIEGLPGLLTIALLRTTVDTPGWEEMRKFAGRRFATATEAVDEMSTARPSLLLNRENIVHRLDVLIEELTRLRRLLDQGDEDALTKTLAKAAEGRSRWMSQRRQGMWADRSTFDAEDVPSTGKQISRMLLGNLASRLKRTPGESEAE